MTMLYKVATGPVQNETYGIDLARAIGFPSRFIRIAQETSDYLRDREKTKKQGSRALKVAKRRKLVLNLYEMLQQARKSRMDYETLAVYLRRLQSEFIRRMEEIEGVSEESGIEGSSGEPETRDQSCR